MKLKSIANAVTSKIGRQVLTVQKHSPVLLFGAGVVGIVATVVIASRATLKLDEVLDEAYTDLENARTLKHPDYSEDDKKRDTVLIYTRTAIRVGGLYAPAAVLGVLSIAALTSSHVILTRRNVAITAAYAALDKGFREYRQRVVSELGIEKDREFRYAMDETEIVEETEQGPVVKKVKRPTIAGRSIYAQFFDESNSNWHREPSYNQIFLSCQQNYANDLLRARGHVFLNDVYDMLGIKRTKEGAIVGWVLGGGGDDRIDFGVFEGDRHSGMRFVLGQERSIILDFNVDGIIYDKI